MKTNCSGILAVVILGGTIVGCSHLTRTGPNAAGYAAATNALREVEARYAPDSRSAIFNVGLEPRGSGLILTGEVDRAEAKAEVQRVVERAGVKAVNQITLLPSEALGEKVYGISCLSVASGRELPDHKAEMGTQILMGDVVRLWKQTTNPNFRWYLSQSSDGYLSWLEDGTIVRCTQEQVESWNRGPLLIVTAFDDAVLEKPEAEVQPVSDVVIGDLVKRTGEAGEWFKVELPDGRAGFLPKKSVEDYPAWKQSRKATPENIEKTAFRLMGRPYLWGGNSPKGLDCSGFTKVVYLLNGIELAHKASQQARQGVEVPLDPDLSQLRKGDLVFFGHRARRGMPESVTHVGLYLGGKLFMQSSERVRISSLDPESPVRDQFRIRTLIKARRILNGS